MPSSALLALLMLTGCTPQQGDAGASVAPSVPANEQATPADAAWIAGMAAHHDQAVALAELAEGRAADPEVLASAARITAAQAAEADALRAWLSRRGLTGEPHEAADMPGEISSTTFARAETVSGPTFDRVFVEAMIRHHDGAVQMSETRLAETGAASVTRWARTIATEQTLELDRLRDLAERLPADSTAD